MFGMLKRVCTDDLIAKRKENRFHEFVKSLNIEINKIKMLNKSLFHMKIF